MSNKKIAKAKGKSTAIVANGDVNIGLSYDDAKNIAMDTFKANFISLAGDAKRLVDERVEEITEDILQRLKKQHQDVLTQAQDPNFIASIYEVQKGYAMTGDKDLEKILIEMLIERSKEKRRSTKQIVLSEAIKAVQKITTEQQDILSTVLLFREMYDKSLTDHKLLGAYWDKHVLPFLNSLTSNKTTYSHLEYAGCGSVKILQENFESILESSYGGLFNNGFNLDFFRTQIPKELDEIFLIDCLNDTSKKQVNALNIDKLNHSFQTLSISQSDRRTLERLFRENTMQPEKIKQKTIAIRDYMATFIKVWNQSDLKQFKLTSVGTAIAHANIKLKIGNFANLDLWINDNH